LAAAQRTISMAALAVVALLDTAAQVAQVETISMAVATQELVALAAVVAVAVVVHTKQTFMAPALGSFTVVVAGVGLGCLALAAMGRVAWEDTTTAALVALKALAGLMGAPPLVMLDPEAHMVVPLEGVDITN
jgi:hypothetical protein